MAVSGIGALLELLAGCGVRYLFGNPGTTELPLNDALAAQQRIKYILGLQEIPVVAIADGYAQASQSPGVVNLHACCGLGNAMGMLYNAYREGTPLLITAGQQDRRLMFEEPILWGTMVEVVRPWTKWAAEISRVEDLPSAVRRALQTALTPPTGPVFLSLPLDVQMAVAEQLDLTPPRPADPHLRPPIAALQKASQAILAAQNPAILVGSRLCQADATEELVALAELLGAPVFYETPVTYGRCAFPSGHPLAAGPLPFWSPEIRQRLAEFDLILAVGVKLLELYIYHEPSRAIPEQIRIVQIDDSPWELGKNYPLEVAVWGHPKPALAELRTMIAAAMSEAELDSARKRAAGHAQAIADNRARLRQQAVSEAQIRPISSLCLMETLAKVLPPDVAIVEETPVSTRQYLSRVGTLPNTSGYFAQRGWALGWGLNCAIGVRLAWPHRPVLALIGDGSALYGIQGLWTAVHYRIPVCFVICNNAQYRILKNCARLLKLPQASAGRFVGLDVTEPQIDYVALARSFGVPALRICEPDVLADAVAHFLRGDVPVLIDVPISNPD